MQCTTIYRNGAHRWLAFGQDPARPDNIVDTTQYAVCSSKAVVLLDPGGMEVFPTMIAAVTRELAVEDIRHLFLSHQDPDVCSALPLWRRVCRPDVQIHTSWMWASFISHFDREANMTQIPDEGGEINLGGEVRLRLLPAHYLHSSGNYHVYDAAAKILFTGDVGAAMVPERRSDMFVTDFADHVRHMEGFHRRWMGSAAARDAWVAMVSKLKIDILAPQHGLMFRGDDVKRFIDWFAGLEVGTGVSVLRNAAR
jgi:flavorubredoxin